MTNEFNPDWDTQAVLVEEIQRMAKRIEELEAKDEPVAWEQFYPDIGKNQFAYLPPSPFSISGKPQSSQQEKNEFNPDWDTQAVLVEEIQRMAKRIEELEAKDAPVFNKPHLDIEGPLHVVCRCPACKVQPQRKPLTDEEIWACLPKDPDEMHNFARAIEAAHGIKGEA